MNIKSKIHCYKGKDAFIKSMRLEHILYEMYIKGELHNMSQIRLTGVSSR